MPTAFDVLAPPSAPDFGGTKTPAPLDDETREQKLRRAAADTAAKVEEVEPRWKAPVGAAPPSWSDMKAPEWKPLAPMPPQETTSPAEAWGSLAMFAAAIGGAMTRTHAMTALNAAAEVLKGFHQGDVERNKYAIERWKSANDNVLQSLTYQANIYRAIMAGKREDELAHYHAASIALRDEQIQNLAAKGDAEAIRKVLKDRDQLYEKLLEKSGHAEDAAKFMTELAGLRQSSDYQALAGNPLQQRAMEYDLLSKYESLDTRGGGGKQDIATARQVYATQFMPGGVAAPDAPKFDEWYKTGWKQWGGGATERGPYQKGSRETRADGAIVEYKGTGDWRDETNWTVVTPAPTPAPATPAETPPAPEGGEMGGLPPGL